MSQTIQRKPRDNARDERPSERSAGNPGKERIALMKSLECLCGEAERARLPLVANLIGAAVEAIRDELDGPAGEARAAAADLAFSLPDFSGNGLLTDGVGAEIDDEDFFDDED
jgi:hypothetical protein